MLSGLMVSAMLLVGQTAAPPETEPVPEKLAQQEVPVAPTPERWELMKVIQGSYAGWLLDGNRMSISGWTDASFTASSDRHSNLPLGFNYRANEPLLQQNWVRFERTVVTTGTSDPSFGFRFDTILPGSDYRFTLARGIFNAQLTAAGGQPQRYGIDPIQFYGEGYFPTIAQGMDVKVGHFFAIYGVESNAAIDNALWSHANTFINNPFTHTGVLTTTKLTPTWTIQAGLVVGSDDFIGPEDTPTFTGGCKWAPPGGRDSVLVTTIVGAGRYNTNRKFHNPDIFDVVYTHQFNARLSYNLEGLYGFTSNVPEIGRANWAGVINYLTYAFTSRLNGNVRLEFFDDFQGQRTGFAGLYSALTLGFNYHPQSWFIVRPEVRYDYNDSSRPYEDKHGLLTAGFDVILRW
jgi:hypothetical protein